MSAKDEREIRFYRRLHQHQRARVDRYDSGDGRHVKVEFEDTRNGVKVTETFEPDNIYSIEMQRSGWQAILENFKKYVEQN